MKASSLPLGLRPLTIAIAIAGLVLAAVLTWTSFTVNRDSNARLLRLQVRQAAAAATEAIPSVQSQLVDALLVETDTGKPAAFKRFSANKVGAEGEFASISLWRKTATGAQELALRGTKPLLVTDDQAARFFAGVHPSASLQVAGPLKGTRRRLGYAEMPPGKGNLVVYAETELPARQEVVVPKSSAFNDLNFAIYFGPHTNRSDLIEASVATPVQGLHASASVPLGDTSLTIVGTPTHELAGALSASLAWIVLGFGLALSFATATTVEYVGRRRRVAEDLAAENERLYVEQRDIAGTLQHALLPELPHLRGAEVAARYMPGVVGIEVGGDWYDVIECDESRCIFVVGDVSGRGLGAATTMAALRFATRAYVAQGDEPATVLRKLSDLLDFDTTQRFATVLIGEVDLAGHRLALASAGHLPPLLMGEDGSRYISVPTGTPVGITGPPRPSTISVDVPPGSMLVAFTDGLVERRGENLQAGLERLRQAALTQSGPLEAILDRMTATLVPAGADDDTVLLGLRWRA